MSAPPPMAFRWDGEAMIPQHPKRADEAFTVGERYILAEYQERSTASHAHYFAAVADAWQSLPDELLSEYPTPEHLRKKMLIRAGYADQREVVCATKAEALRWSAIVGPMDAYSVITVRDNVVRIYTAQSQSFRAMGKAAFQASKDAVLSAITDLLERKAA